MKHTILAAFVLLTAGCSLRYDFTECKSNADCERLAQDGEVLECRSEECIAVTPEPECQRDSDCTDAPRTVCRANVCTEPVTTDMGQGDMTMADMGDAGNDTGDSGVDMDMAVDMGMPCQRNSECNTGDVSAWQNLCIEGFCQTAVTNECRQLRGNVDSDRTQLFGVILPLNDFNIGPPLNNSIELAVDEVNAAGGLPGGRNLIYLVCDDQGSTELALDNARHLVETLKVPALVGPLFSQAATRVAIEVTIPAGVLLMSPAGSADTLSTLQDNDLVWRTISSDRWQAKALADRALQFAPSRVAILYKDDTYGSGLNSSLINELSARGISGINGLRSRAYPDPAGEDGGDLMTVWQAAITGITAAGWVPDVYIYIGTTEAATLTGQYFSGGNTPVPHVFSHGAAPALPVLATSLAGASPALPPLVTAVAQNIFNGENFSQFAARYAGKFPNEGFLTISTLTYDATLSIALAMAAIPQENPITGKVIAENLPKIADVENGDPVDARGSFIGNAIGTLSGGGTIDFSGVSGALDFDANGDIRSDYLRFVAVPSAGDPSIYELSTDAVYLYGTPPGNSGFWRLQCNMNDQCATQDPMGQACVQGVCLEVGCADNSNECDEGVCVPQGPGFCAPDPPPSP